MREKLVRSDLLECVIGLGPNLFYNASMEACIIICRTKKSDNHKGQILFINAVNEVTRKNAQSFLELQHIEKIAGAYEAFRSDGKIAKKVSIRDVEKHDFSLNLPLYISVATATNSGSDEQDIQSRYESWVLARDAASHSCEQLIQLLTEEGAQDG